MQIAGITLPDPQMCLITMLPVAEYHMGYNGSVLVDRLAVGPAIVHVTRLRWQKLTHAEKDAVLSCWFALASTPAGVSFTGPDGLLTGTAYMKPPDFRFQKDSEVQGNGTLLWNVFLLVHVVTAGGSI